MNHEFLRRTPAPFMAISDACRDFVARRAIDLPYDDGDQDWEYTAPRDEQLPEYLAAYTSGELNDDERFVLMAKMIDRLNGLPDEKDYAPFLRLIEENVELHLKTVWYWASTDYVGEAPEFSWEIAPAMREILWRHRALWK